MRIIYKDTLLFFIVILSFLSVLIFIFYHVSNDIFYEQAWDHLEEYALTINTHDTNTQQFNLAKIKNTSAFLKDQEISLVIYQKPGKVLYTSEKHYPILTAKRWHHLKAGHLIQNRHDYLFKQKGPMIDLYVPYFDGQGQLRAVFLLAMPHSIVLHQQKRIIEKLYGVLSLLIFLALLVSYLVAYYVTRQVRSLNDATKAILQGDFEVEMPTYHLDDELSQLTNNIKEMAQQIQSCKREVKDQTDRRKQILADATHEMRTPLTTISGLLEGLEYNTLTGEARDMCLKMMRAETDRLIRLVNESLEYERIVSGKMKLHREPTLLEPIIQNIVCQLEVISKEKGITFTLSLPPNLTANVDKDRFIQIIFNILQNAVQFTEQGHIDISGEYGHQETIIHITDPGIGMTPEEAAHIWDRYYKADPSRGNVKWGESGLGLSIVYKLMKLHGGEVDVYSKLGKGTTFTLIFPAK